MTNKTNDSSRLDGRLDLNPDAPQRRSYGHLLPKDFPHRLVRFKEATGFTWSGLAGKIGVDYRQMYRWRKGAEPSGGALHAPLRVRRHDTRRPGDLHRRAVPVDLLQELTGPPRPRSRNGGV